MRIIWSIIGIIRFLILYSFGIQYMKLTFVPIYTYTGNKLI